ncbi:MAG: InlB B-repeat-containing protein, partial [Bacteroidales bacterium]|nr:InlB B-repeat-containing protein [Bacteroidales bacterium]
MKCPKWGYLFVISLILTLNSSAQFSLSYDANWGNGSMTDTLLLTNDSMALPLNEFVYFGYHFTHWNSLPDGSGVSYFPNDSFAIANTDTILYAQWGKYCGGNGSALNPWQICNSEALILLSQSSEDWGDTIIQTDHILFSNDEASSDWDGDGIIGSFKDPAGFSPIGNSVKAFSGHYDGQGFRIDSLYTNNTNDFTGLFGITDSALIENVILNSAEINGFNYIGGLIGRAQNDTRLRHLFFDGSVSGRAFVGGIVGSLESSTLKASCSMGEVNAGGSMAGGLTGRISASTVLNSYSSGYVIGELQNVGGIAGFVQDNTVIKNTFSTAGVTGVKYVGSFVGILSGSTVTNCYATGVALGDG